MLFLATTNSVKARKPERKTNRKSAQWTYSETAVDADRHWPLLTKHEMIPYGILLIITATHSHVENCILNQQQSSNSAEFVFKLKDKVVDFKNGGKCRVAVTL